MTPLTHDVIEPLIYIFVFGVGYMIGRQNRMTNNIMDRMMIAFFWAAGWIALLTMIDTAWTIWGHR